MTGVDSALEQRMEAYESMKDFVRGLIAERRDDGDRRSALQAGAGAR